MLWPAEAAATAAAAAAAPVPSLFPQWEQEEDADRKTTPLLLPLQIEQC